MNLQKKSQMYITWPAAQSILWNGTECVGFGSCDHSLDLYCWEIL